MNRTLAMRGSSVTPGEATIALALRGITRTFGAVVALRDVSLTVRAGTVHALLGENGAGKSTLMRVAYGMTQPDAGIVEVQGVVRVLRSPAQAIACGIGMVHQHFTLVPAMTVAENLSLGQRGAYSRAARAARVAELSRSTGFRLDADAEVGDLAVNAQQRVEIAKALAGRASVLVLDEPTGVLAPAEVDDLLQWVRAFVERGNAVVLITHKLREALAVADDVSVLRAGSLVYTGPAGESSEEVLTQAMLGGAVDAGVGAAAGTRPGVPVSAPVVFRATEMSVRDAAGVTRVRGASVEIRAGEVVGVAGVERSGQRELLRALAGRLPISGGALVRPDDVGFVPEDRHHEAVLLARSLVENVALRGAGLARGRMDWPARRARTAELVARFDVRTSGPSAPMRALSGGNQQKLVLARELGLDGPGTSDAVATPRALVLENPTRGLDIRAAAAIRDRVRDAAQRGAAVVVYSSDLDEILSLATRVLVMFDGTVRETGAARDAIGRAMLGLT